MQKLMPVDTSALLQGEALSKQSKPAGAARQFEALLIAQMLKSARETSSGWLGTGEDQAAEPAMALAEEHFAQALSASGGLGLARLIEKNLGS